MAKFFAFITSNGKKVFTSSKNVIVTENGEDNCTVTINGLRFTTKESAGSLYNKLSAFLATDRYQELVTYGDAVEQDKDDE